MSAEQTAHAGLVILAAIVCAGVVAWLTGTILRLSARGRYASYLTTLYNSCHRPWKYSLTALALLIAAPMTGLSGTAFDIVEHAIIIGLIGSAAWLTTRILFFLEDTTFRRLPLNVADNRRTRKIRTQVSLLRRLTAVVIAVVALPAALMTIPPLRTFGASLLASAGIVGVVAGLAAQTTLGHVFAGLQLAFADSLRYDDVVVVEGEWGRVEEIRLTHVVLQLWDHRRLILPTTYFTSQPFQNWTRHEARVLASIYLHLDYTAPVGALRVEAQRVIEESPLWDQREWVLQVVDSTPTTMLIRVLASAADAPSAWDLRCDVREKLIDFLRDNYPSGLPRVRASLLDEDPGEAAQAAQTGTGLGSSDPGEAGSSGGVRS
jgi:small-conductance mechanosensitive channel